MSNATKARRIQISIQNAVNEYDAAATEADASKWVARILALRCKLAALE